MTDVTINWFEYLKGKYGKLHPRKPRYATSTLSR